MLNGKSIIDVISARYSCRTYHDTPIELALQQQLTAFMEAHAVGPLGMHLRLLLAAANEADRQALKGLSTYGFIKGATGFILGATPEGRMNLEDFGYVMEHVVLYATSLGLGTCWIGGTFAKSRFAARLELRDNESLPAVIALGYCAAQRRLPEAAIRRQANADRRLPWERLFFDDVFGVPLNRDAAGPFATALDGVRMGPSASNKQPWRIVKAGEKWHFYVQRTPGYARRNRFLLDIADMQRIDMGIAMGHFALIAEELGQRGQWVIREPAIQKPDPLTEYVVTWEPA
ncbi:MAG TPA: nitroreductase family protein [Anaerolineae bacterium]|nr:nitroreductase family protein [Anaerolineae bacterium]HQH39031.1 nitroreductase family protein [Anaerolineae bacterium]